MAGIIKVGRTSPTLQGATTAAFQFDDMQDAYLARVRGEAAKIIADARDEAARLKKQAAEEGKQTALKAVEASLRGRAAVGRRGRGPRQDRLLPAHRCL